MRPATDAARTSSRERFGGRLVVVAGAAQGIGKATARLFAEEGATVALLDVSATVEETLREIAGDDRGMAVRCDVTDAEQCVDVVRRVVAEHGRIDVLVAVSGVLQAASSVGDLDPREWNRVMAVNLSGPFHLARAVTPHMIREKSGSIVNISSWWGRSGHAYFAAYCASKAGLIVFTQALADELAEHGVRANTICPGNINTTMHRRALETEAAERGITFEEMKSSEWAKIPLGFAGEPEEIARAAMFLASNDAAYITGASLDVNGGVVYH